MVQWRTGEKKNIKKFRTFKQHKTKKGRCFSVLSLFCAHHPISSFAVFLVVGLREREDFCIPVIWIAKVLLDLSDTFLLSHSMLGLGSAALIYMGSLIKTIRCFFDSLHWWQLRSHAIFLRTPNFQTNQLIITECSTWVLTSSDWQIFGERQQ